MAALDAFIGKVATQIINPLIMLIAAGAFIAVLWGIFEFIRKGGDATKRKEAQEAILWGIVGLVIIFGAYGLINLALGTFGIAPVHRITTP